MLLCCWGGGGGWGHGVQQTDGCLLRRIWTSSIICASVRVLLACVCVDYPCQCMHVCFLLHLAVQPVNRSVESVWAVLLCQILRSPLTHWLSGSLGTETAAMPLHNSSARPWTNPKEVWYHESQMRVTTGPPQTSLQQLIFPEPNFGPFKNKFFAHDFTFFFSQEPILLT